MQTFLLHRRNEPLCFLSVHVTCATFTLRYNILAVAVCDSSVNTVKQPRVCRFKWKVSCVHRRITTITSAVWQSNRNFLKNSLATICSSQFGLQRSFSINAQQMTLPNLSSTTIIVLLLIVFILPGCEVQTVNDTDRPEIRQTIKPRPHMQVAQISYEKVWFGLLTIRSESLGCKTIIFVLIQHVMCLPYEKWNMGVC